MDTDKLDDLAIIILKLLLILFMGILFVDWVDGASVTQTVNMTIDAESVTVQAPSGTFQTTCGQQLTHSFDVTHTFDQQVYYYSNTTINTTIYIPPQNNCTVIYNWTNATTNVSMGDLSVLLEKLNSTRDACNNAKQTCFDLYNSNLNLTINVSTGQLMDNISVSNQRMMDFLALNILPEKEALDDCRMANDRAANALNVSGIKVTSLEHDNTLYMVLCVVELICIVTLLTFMLGRNFLKKQTFGPTSMVSQQPIASMQQVQRTVDQSQGAQ